MDELAFLDYLVTTNILSENQKQEIVKLKKETTLSVAEILQNQVFQNLTEYEKEKQSFLLQHSKEDTSVTETLESTPDSIQKIISTPSRKEDTHSETQEISQEEIEAESTLFKEIESLAKNYKTTNQDSASSKAQTILSPMMSNGLANELKKNFNLAKPPSILPENMERYDILKTLGEGGMGIVQKVRDKILGRDVALKSLKTKKINHLSKTQQIMIWRLKSEAEITAILEHPNIIPLYDMQKKIDGSLYFTMRAVKGRTLKSIFKEYRIHIKDYDENYLLSIFFKVCDAMAYAHSNGVIHRDLKPENIMVGEFGVVYVMDWGIAKQLKKHESQEEQQIRDIMETITQKEEQPESYQTKGGLGTIGYMAPEQAEDASKAEIPADIFALGRILQQIYTLLSPAEEFQRKLMIMKQRRKEPDQEIPLKNQVPHFGKKTPNDIKAIIDKATDENSTARYASVSEMVNDIKNYQNNIRISVRDYKKLELFQKWIKRNKKSIALAFLVISLWSIFNYQKFREQKIKVKEALLDAIAQKKEASLLPEELLGEKIKKFLGSLNKLNFALSIRPNTKEIEEEKKATLTQLILLACQSEDYKLADYLVEDLKTLSLVVQENEIKEYANIVQQKKNKVLIQHKARFNYWIQRFEKKQNEKGDREEAIFEISRMQEKEIFQQLRELLTQGTSYFLNHQEREASKEEFYLIIATTIGRLGKPDTGQFLYHHLESITRNLLLFPRGKRPIAQLEYAIALTQAIANAKAKGFANLVMNIRFKFGENESYWQRTSQTYKKLSQLDQLEKKQVKNADEYFARFYAKLQNKNFKEALKDLDFLILRSPQTPKLYLDRGIIKHRLKLQKEALKDLKIFLTLTKNEINPEILKIRNNIIKQYPKLKTETENEK